MNQNLARNINEDLILNIQNTPVTLLNGVRQSGKSTLLKELQKQKIVSEYITLDSLETQALLSESPEKYLESLPTGTAIDEIQRMPEVFLSIKKVVDENRMPGRFILSGSANVLALPKLADSLAGRMQINTLYPLSSGEKNGIKENFIDWAFNSSSALKREKSEKLDWEEMVLNTGFPETYKSSGTVLENWYQAFETTLIQKDIRELSDIEKLGYIPKLLRLTAGRVASTVSYSDLARSLEISNMSVKRYLELLKALYLILEVPAWSGSYTKRLTKSPKIFFLDNGFLGYQLGLDKNYLLKNREVFGKMLENLIATELIKQVSWSDIGPKIYHFREVSGEEIDLILENRRGEIVAIEVKSSNRIKPEYLKNLNKFKEKMGDKVVKSILVYTGDQLEVVGDTLVLPAQKLFEKF